MSVPRRVTEIQGMPFRTPFTWFVLLGIGLSFAGMARALTSAPGAQAVASRSRASAQVAPISGAEPSVVTQVSPSPTAAAAAQVRGVTDVAAQPDEATAVIAAATPAAATPEVELPPSPAAVAPLIASTPAESHMSATATPEAATGTAAVGTLPQQTLPTPTPVAPPALATDSAAKSSALLDMMNSARADAGLPALVVDATLQDVALARANNLIENGYFDHYSPDGESAFTELAARGVSYRLAGENLARNNYVDAQTVEAAFDALMASPGHRANILEPRFASVGVASVLSGHMWLYVTVFKD